MHIFIISNRAVLRSINFAMEELITYVTYIKYSSVQLAIPTIINQQNCYFKNAKKNAGNSENAESDGKAEMPSTRFWYCREAERITEMRQ